MSDAVSVRVPATSANLGPGFDCLGLALDLRGTITIRRSDEPTADEPLAAMALIGARRVFERTHIDAYQWQASYEGTLPIARGLGASAVARVGGLVAANELSDGAIDREDLLSLATELEGHVDNAAPALFGGFQVSAVDGKRVFHTSAPLPDGLQAVLFVPEMRVATKDARRVVPDSLSRADAVFNIGRSSLLVAALASGRLDLLDSATQDRLHQPQRQELFPATRLLFRAALAAGALGVFLSGAGPTVLALAAGREMTIGYEMAEVAEKAGVEGVVRVVELSPQGAHVVSVE